MSKRGRSAHVLASGVIAAMLAASSACCRKPAPKPGHVLDEARAAGRAVESFPAADEDYFHDMDGGAKLPLDQVRGRNTWIVWTGGDDRFWDTIAYKSVGTLDFLKTVSSYDPARDPTVPAGEQARLKDTYKFSRDNRWSYMGLVNEPCFEKAVAPDPQRFGLWLDRRRSDCPADPFENHDRYPGVVIGARGKTQPAGSYYGYATGIVGLRLFPNPDFDDAAAKRWDANRYYNDPSYYASKDLVRPYRVGMSCGFCHVGPNPVKPPLDPENPAWANLSSNVGAQYFWVDRIFVWQSDPTSFMYQLFHTSRPGALDTSLVSTDNINNPRTMNAVYELGPRLEDAQRWGKETLAGGGHDNKQINDYVSSGPLTKFYQPPETVWTPRVLKDGSDSVGVLGALNRVFLNIGLFSEEWLLHFNALVGGKRSSPIEIAVAEKNSAYWQATETQTLDLARFFLATATPHRLKDAPGGAAILAADAALRARGKEVFAERCARCHSSKAPSPPEDANPGACDGPHYLDCWSRYWAWTKTDGFKQKMREIVGAEDFLDGNYLSTDLRVPVTLLQTNACSPLARNALADNIWDNFSSSTYKHLPSVGTITVHHPITGEPRQFTMPAGGRGYTRPPSLISAWSTAPFLLNNTVGTFNPSPSVEGRLKSFQDAIEQMLWPERRARDPLLGGKIPGPSLIDRTTTASYLRVPGGYLPDSLRGLLDKGSRLLPWLFTKDGVELGPIPAGTPVNLLSNLDLEPQDLDEGGRLKHDEQLLALLLKIQRDLKALPPNASDEEGRKIFANVVEPMLALSTCPDFIVNRGHYFGTNLFAEEPGLGDDDKRALIAFLKTF